MIESALAYQPQTAPLRDATYQSWQSAARKAVMRHDLNERTAGPIPTFGSMIHSTALAAQDMNYAPANALNNADGTRPDLAYAGEEKEEAFSFGDVIDIINPLQHLPVIGTIYRKLSGDTLKPFSNIIGGALFGGPIGAVSSAMNVAIKESTGKDIAENAFAMVGFDETPEESVKPEIVIQSDMDFAAAVRSEKSLAVTNLYGRAEEMRRNFAAKDSSYSWNT